jgi:hypothetical protein
MLADHEFAEGHSVAAAQGARPGLKVQQIIEVDGRERFTAPVATRFGGQRGRATPWMLTHHATRIHRHKVDVK